MYFATVVRSGVIPRIRCIPPSESREVITSSKISRTPAAVVASRSARRNWASPGMTPPAPWSGSTITAASSSAFALIVRTASASSL